MYKKQSYTQSIDEMSAFSGFRDRDLAMSAAEDEYLDAVFDTDLLEREMREMGTFDDWNGGGSQQRGKKSQPAFDGFTGTRDIFDRIEEVRELQQRVFHSHLKVEVNLNNFVQTQSVGVSKAEASAKVCRDFRNEFDAKKDIIEDVSELLSELAAKVDSVNELVVMSQSATAEPAADSGAQSKNKKQSNGHFATSRNSRSTRPSKSSRKKKNRTARE